MRFALYIMVYDVSEEEEGFERVAEKFRKKTYKQIDFNVESTITMVGCADAG